MPQQRKSSPTKTMSEKEALHLLIATYTKRRDWFMVERLYNDLGKLIEKEDKVA